MIALNRSLAGAALTVERILDRTREVAERISVGAVARDRNDELPYDCFLLVREARIGALRVPARLGGPGGTVSDVSEALVTLATGDANVAHALRTHFASSESLFLGPESEEQRKRARQMLSGALFGGAGAELGTSRPSNDTTSTLVRSARGYLLNGDKYYTTGTAFCDYVSTSALTEAGETVRLVLPINRPGIDVLNDWDGMGQRLTASGGVRFVDVEVTEEDIVSSAPARNGFVARHASTYRQLILMAAQAGSVRGLLREGTEYGRSVARPIPHSHAETARGDYFVQLEVGRIAAISHAVDVLIADAARTLDHSAAAILADDPRLDRIITEAAIAIAKAQSVIAPLALEAAERIFNVGGASATSRKRGFDRHWRNIRTIKSHNPVFYKEKAIGDYLLNDEPPPTDGGYF
jgi:alkylation response protein AidB-like acyl-CoA dehydrogenase